jgi:uncharacterized damage-inducible protein DinB
MEIPTVASFIEYYESLRRRTRTVVGCIPPQSIDWTYQEGKFTLGDLLRHVAAIERYMYAETVRGRESRYPGHGRELASGYEEVLSFFERAHRESMELFGELTDGQLRERCLTPAGASIPVWKWLRSLCEHEVHHRGQIYIYLGLLGVPGPPLYGLTSEQVRERSRSVL